MIGRVQQIEQEIRDLEVAIAELNSAIEDLRQGYLDSLAATFVQEMILAVYRVCTGKYALAFLNLSLDQKFQLQQDLQILCHRFRAQILALSGAISDRAEASPTDSPTQPEEAALTEILSVANGAVSDLLTSFGFPPRSEQSPLVQLLDLELANRQALTRRSEIRVLAARSQSLKAEVSKRKQAKMSAEAELAWRSTWMELLQD
ncbi:MAG: hypothetical protein SFT94_02120 [Pseudanabaenaceae cyanobacterium bins.68]|nr:hypothetical protein [Pseudanabaenaceae cyanobacterium bins.68]